MGTLVAGKLLEMADAIKDGEETVESASAKAIAMIEEGTSAAQNGG